MVASSSLYRPELSVTLDESSDYILIKKIIEYFGDTNSAWVNGRSVIWSDRSGGDITGAGGGPALSAIHTYPTVAGNAASGAGSVAGYSGTLDWTNGYMLNVSALGSFNFMK